MENTTLSTLLQRVEKIWYDLTMYWIDQSEDNTFLCSRWYSPHYNNASTQNKCDCDSIGFCHHHHISDESITILRGTQYFMRWWRIDCQCHTHMAVVRILHRISSAGSTAIHPILSRNGDIPPQHRFGLRTYLLIPAAQESWLLIGDRNLRKADTTVLWSRGVW